MAFSLTEFKANLEYSGARPNLFEFRMQFPAVISAGKANDKLRFMAKAASLPASNIDQIVVPYFGREIKLAGDRTFEDYTVTVINDEDFAIRNALEQWLNAINSHAGNRGIAISPAEYQVDAEVIQFSRSGEEIKTYKMVGLFPTNVSAIDTSWDTNNTIEEFTVTFAYSWWESDTTT